MTWTIVDAVFDLHLPPAQKATLQAMARYAHADGSNVKPNVQTLAEDAGLKPRTCQAALRRLEAAGLIACTTNRHGGVGHPATYAIRIERFVLHLHARARAQGVRWFLDADSCMQLEKTRHVVPPLADERVHDVHPSAGKGAPDGGEGCTRRPERVHETTAKGARDAPDPVMEKEDESVKEEETPAALASLKAKEGESTEAEAPADPLDGILWALAACVGTAQPNRQWMGDARTLLAKGATPALVRAAWACMCQAFDASEKGYHRTPHALVNGWDTFGVAGQADMRAQAEARQRAEQDRRAREAAALRRAVEERERARWDLLTPEEQAAETAAKDAEQQAKAEAHRQRLEAIRAQFGVFQTDGMGMSSNGRHRLTDEERADFSRKAAAAKERTAAKLRAEQEEDFARWEAERRAQEQEGPHGHD